MLDCLEKAEPKSRGTKSNAAPLNLFVVDENCEKLSKEKAKTFHTLIAKMLFATKRARPDTGTAISYLTTRVREPDQIDWLKMVHLFKYVRGTKYLPLILSSENSGILKWYNDGPYAVHPNMRGHTGGGLAMERGSPILASRKQKLNPRSFTESEIVGVNQLMPSVLWARNF